MPISQESDRSPNPMRVLPTHLLKPGQITDQDVCNVNGQRLVAKGTELTARHIASLQSWMVVDVAIWTPTERPPPPSADDQARRDAATVALLPLFRHNDMSHPVVAELFRLAVAQRVNKKSSP